MGSPFPGPVPSYSNPPINPQFYIPSRFNISNITLGQTTIVTTSVDNNYTLGQSVRLLVPKPYGSFQLNQMQGYVISVISDDTIELDIDSSQNVNAYISSPNTDDVSQVVAIGDINMGVINSHGRSLTTTFIPGSFINISPN